MSEPREPALLALRFLAGFAVLAVAPALVWEALPQLGVDLATANAAARLEWQMLGFVAAAATVVGLARWQRPAAPWRPFRAARGLGTYAVVLVPWVLFLVGYLAAMRRLGHAVPAQPFLDYLAHADAARPGFWVVAVGTCVGAPLAEEVVFRGYLQGALQELLPRWPAIAVAAAVFGAVHGIAYTLPIGLLGVVFGALFARCGSLWPSALVHAAHNTLTLAITVFWPRSVDLLYPGGA